MVLLLPFFKSIAAGELYEPCFLGLAARPHSSARVWCSLAAGIRPEAASSAADADFCTHNPAEGAGPGTLRMWKFVNYSHQGGFCRCCVSLLSPACTIAPPAG